jgi:uncharacterized protein (DUF2147 family)
MSTFYAYLGIGPSGGKILDPENGKTYKCSLTLEEGGQKLKVRGLIGFSLLGRTQHGNAHV